MIVTKVEPLTKTKFKVYIDGQFAFVLYKGELSRFGIREEADITEETERKIRGEVILKRAKQRAMHLLEDMDRTEAALREKLRQGLYPPDAVDGAVEYVKSFGYLNDARYAENFVRSRKDNKSRKEIWALLMSKGVSSELAEAAFEVCYGSGQDEGEQKAIRALLRKKRFNPADTDETKIQKMYGYFARKGFRYDTVRQVIQNYDVNA